MHSIAIITRNRHWLDALASRRSWARRTRHGTQRKQTKRIAAWLREALPRDVIVLRSPARRTVEAAGASTDRFQKRIPQLPKRRGNVVLARGYFPGLSEGAIGCSLTFLGTECGLCLEHL